VSCLIEAAAWGHDAMSAWSHPAAQFDDRRRGGRSDQARKGLLFSFFSHRWGKELGNFPTDGAFAEQVDGCNPISLENLPYLP